MKKYILLFVLMSSVLATTALASSHTKGVCLKSLMKQSQTLWPDNSAFVKSSDGSVGQTTNGSPVRIKQ